MNKILFIDRDGTLVVEPPITKQIDNIEDLVFMPNVFSTLSKIAKELNYLLVMVSNQDGLGTKAYPFSSFEKVQNMIIKYLKNEGIEFYDILIDKSFEHENLPTRKPGIALVNKYLNNSFDLNNSFVIGDRLSDIKFAKNIGCKSIFLNTDFCNEANFCTNKWNDIYNYLAIQERKTHLCRKTKETEIYINLNIDGKGISKINTGIGFFDHLLEQIAVHGGIDIELKAEGDLYTDEHHTIEDIAIVLGEAFNQALKNKIGIERFAFDAPMDESLAKVVIDFGGRPYIVWNADFKREKIGDMPTEMFFHFFKTFTDNAKCTLHVQAYGNNEHHKIESIFKAFAKALSKAISRNNRNYIPSSKGML